MRKIIRQAAIVAAVLVVGLMNSYVPAQADERDVRTTITDEPGAPGLMLQRFEELTGEPTGNLERVLAVDTGGRELTSEQATALVAGERLDGVEVLGAMPGSRDILSTTMADLADGTHDGKDSSATETSALIFATAVPNGRDWCSTICIERHGRTVWDCLKLGRSEFAEAQR